MIDIIAEGIGSQHDGDFRWVYPQFPLQPPNFCYHKNELDTLYCIYQVHFFSLLYTVGGAYKNVQICRGMHRSASLNVVNYPIMGHGVSMMLDGAQQLLMT